MAIQRPSDQLKNKVNIHDVVNRLSECTAEDFIEICAILEELGIAVDGLLNADSANPYYGRYTSLALLAAAHTTAPDNAWAIIEEGQGITPKVAFWDGAAWSVTGATSDKIFVASYSNLPNPGLENKWYITLDKNKLYLWYNAKYNLMGASEDTSIHKVLKAAFASVGSITEIAIPGIPDSIDLYINSKWQVQDYGLTNQPIIDFSYNALTGIATLVTPTEDQDFIEYVAHGQNLRLKQPTIVTIDKQINYPFSGNPATIDVFLNSKRLLQNIDYTRTFYSSNNKVIITNQELINNITINDLLEIITH